MSNFRGPFDVAQTYQPLDTVQHNGGYWRAVTKVSSPWYSSKIKDQDFPGVSRARGECPWLAVTGADGASPDYSRQPAVLAGALFMLGAEHVGANPGLIDKASVERFQGAIMALPPEKMDPTFTALKFAINNQANAFGVMGPATRTALLRFNELYGWPADGNTLTAGTLASLDRADLKPGYAAKMAALDADTAKVADVAKAAIASGALTPPPQVKEAAQTLTATATQAQAQAATPELKAEAAAVQAQAAQAQAQLTKAATPAETAAALVQVQAATAGVAALVDKMKGGGGWEILTRKYAGVPVYGWSAIGVGGII